jgi:cytochrome P450
VSVRGADVRGHCWGVASAGEPGERITLEELTRDPHSVHAWLREVAPVCWVPVLDGWLVTRRDLVMRVLTDPIVFTVDDPGFSTAKVVGASMLSLDGPMHRRHRRPFSAAFRREGARTVHGEMVDRLAAGLVAAVRHRGSAEVRTDVAGPLASGVMAAVFGLDRVPPQRLAQWYVDIVRSVSAISAGLEPTPEGAAAVRQLRAGVLAAMDGDPTDAAGVLHCMRQTGLSDEEVVSNTAVVMFGGIETTEGLIATSALHLLSHPDLARRARHRDDLLDRAVTESLRIEPTASRVDRYATRATVLADQPIRAGDLVIASLAAANRDPAAYPDPDVYDIDRPGTPQHLAFAAGPHACLAADLAQAQARAVLHELLHLPELRLDRSRSDPPRGLVFRKPDRVVVTWSTDADPAQPEDEPPAEPIPRVGN